MRNADRVIFKFKLILMKATINIFCALAMTINLASQPATSQLNVNNVKATVAADGILFLDGYNSSSGYEVPANSGKQAIRSASLWIGGLDSQGQLHTAAMTYRGGSDFFYGPMDTINAVGSSCGTNSSYNYVWEINRNELDTFLNYGYISGDISSWPGNGNVANFEAVQLAPFTDVNSDGVYDATAGDSPILKGDQMLFWIMNDNCGAHTETGGLPFGIEVHCTAYAYGCNSLPDSQQVLNNTTFYHFKVINRNSYFYNNVYFTFWADVELGAGNNDLTGSNVSGSAAYVMNGSNDSVYNSGLVMLSIAQLKGPLADTTDLTNNDRDSLYDSFGNVLGANIDETGEQCMFNNLMYYGDMVNTSLGNAEPVNQFHYYNYMKSYWNDSTSLKYGGTGYNSGGINAKYAFPGNSDQAGYGTGFNPQVPWYSFMPPAGPAVDFPDNKKILISAGPFTMQPGETNETEYAIILSSDTATGTDHSVVWSKSFADTRQIRNWYTNQNFPSCPGSVNGINSLEKTIKVNCFPNPSNEFVIVNIEEITGPATFTVYDITGKALINSKFDNGKKINTSAFAPGLYIIKVSDQNSTYTSRFIKQ